MQSWLKALENVHVAFGELESKLNAILGRTQLVCEVFGIELKIPLPKCSSCGRDVCICTNRTLEICRFRRRPELAFFQNFSLSFEFKFPEKEKEARRAVEAAAKIVLSSFAIAK